MRIDLLIKKIGEVAAKIESGYSYDTIHITKDNEMYISEVGSECTDEQIVAIVIGQNAYISVDCDQELADALKYKYNVTETSVDLNNPVKYMLRDIDIYDLGLNFEGDIDNMECNISETSWNYGENLIYTSDKEELIKYMLEEYGLEELEAETEETGSILLGALSLKEKEIEEEMTSLFRAGDYDEIEELLNYQYEAGNC